MALKEKDQVRRLEIRKYPNRRYYDATNSRHLTLEKIHALIKEGYEVDITDSKTGENITSKVLTQIILDLDSPKLDLFPVPLLMQLIRSNQSLIKEFTNTYFNQAFLAFLNPRQHFEEYLRQTQSLFAMYPSAMLPFAGSSPGSKQREVPDDAGENSDMRQTLEALSAQVARLQEELERRSEA